MCAGLLLFVNDLPAATGGGVGDRYLSLALQGDLSAAADLFAASADTAAATGDAELERQFRQRFIDRSETHPPPVRRCAGRCGGLGLSPLLDACSDG